jgi:RNA polymerase sigma-70 factor (ECF subfamily)
MASIEFEEFFAQQEPRLRRALIAAYGPLRGREAAAEALVWAWEHWAEVQRISSPTAYLYRVGQSRSRRWGRPRALFAAPDPPAEPWVEPTLPPALASLSEQQRVAVVLVHGFGWSHREVAELLGLSSSTVQNHVERGLAKLRAALEVGTDV